jgi:hypothetical protein
MGRDHGKGLSCMPTLWWMIRCVTLKIFEQNGIWKTQFYLFKTSFLVISKEGVCKWQWGPLTTSCYKALDNLLNLNNGNLGSCENYTRINIVSIMYNIFYWKATRITYLLELIILFLNVAISL